MKNFKSLRLYQKIILVIFYLFILVGVVNFIRFPLGLYEQD